MGSKIVYSRKGEARFTKYLYVDVSYMSHYLVRFKDVLLCFVRCL